MASTVTQAGNIIAQSLRNGPGISQIAAWAGKAVVSIAPANVRATINTAAKQFLLSSAGQTIKAFVENGSSFLARNAVYVMPVVGAVIAVGVIEGAAFAYSEYKVSKQNHSEGSAADEMAQRQVLEMNNNIYKSFGSVKKQYNKWANIEKANKAQSKKGVIGVADVVVTAMGAGACLAGGVFAGSTVIAVLPQVILAGVATLCATTAIRGSKKALYAYRTYKAGKQMKYLEKENKYHAAYEYKLNELKEASSKVAHLNEENQSLKQQMENLQNKADALQKQVENLQVEKANAEEIMETETSKPTTEGSSEKSESQKPDTLHNHISQPKSQNKGVLSYIMGDDDNNKQSGYESESDDDSNYDPPMA